MARTVKQTQKQVAEGVHRIVAERNLMSEYAFDFEKKILSEMDSVALPVVLDLTKTSLIDSRGIALCVGLLKECEKKGLAFSINVSAELAGFFKLLKLDRVFDLNEWSNS